jgi:hypothetical protein
MTNAQRELRLTNDRRELSLARDRGLTRDTGGAVYVEFLLAFIPLFFMFLGMLQMGLLYGASLVVQHSSNVAVRAAMVVMDDVPSRYDGEERRQVDADASGFGGVVDTLGSALGSILGGGGGGSVAWTGGARLASVEFAAGMPLLPLSPSLASLARTPENETVRAALGLRGMDTPEARMGWGLLYNRMALAVTFPEQPGGSSYATEFSAPTDEGDGGAVTARVTYLYNCQIPLANRLMCDDLFYIRFGFSPGAVAGLAGAFARGEMTYDQFQDALNSMEQRDQRRSRWQPRMNEIGNRVNVLATVAGLSGLLGGPTPRFVPITAEATMPMQSAGYCYDGDGTDTGCSWEQ